MKKIILWLTLVSFLISLAGAVEEDHEAIFEQAQEIINQKISCSELTENQLEILGDYYMEQMHPGEAHEAMDEMMGGEGSESLRQVHINMGVRFYCGSSGSYGMMYGMMGGGMMSGNMMGNYYNYNRNNFNLFVYIPITLLLISLVLIVILLIKKINLK